MTHFYRKRPVVIEAARFKGTPESAEKILAWIKGAGGEAESYTLGSGQLLLNINTMEGYMIARKGAFVIKGIHGEFYPCAPDIFDASYELVE